MTAKELIKERIKELRDKTAKIKVKANAKKKWVIKQWK